MGSIDFFHKRPSNQYDIEDGLKRERKSNVLDLLTSLVEN